ncbi:MAG: tetratricopeptide repeat protein [Myxococcales bacterium]|nr:tetratricopeptide repeat protein [Myxococcales bacterium]
MSSAAIDELERALAELGDDPSPGPALEARRAELQAALAWELGLTDPGRCRILTAAAEASAERLGLAHVRARCLRNRAYLERFGDDYEQAIELARQASSLFEALEEDGERASAEDILANVHASLGALDRALEHSLRNLELTRKSGDRRGLGWALQNLGRVHLLLGDRDEAERWTAESIEVFTAIGHPPGRGRSLGVLADLALERGDLEAAETHLRAALEIWRIYGLERGRRWNHLSLGRLYLRQGRHAEALAELALACPNGQESDTNHEITAAAAACEGAVRIALGERDAAEAALLRALDEAARARAPATEIEAHGLLAELYEEAGDPAAALAHLKARLRLIRAQNDKEMLARARNMQLGMRVAAAEREAEVTERLLYGILPRPIVRELKLHGRAEPVLHDAATVLFTDLVGFTRVAEGMPPRDLVAALDELFGAFDEVIRRHGLEKIKTIGDAYMAAAGIPEPRPEHALVATRAALELRDVVRRLAARPGAPPWQLRIGLHSGPLVAGVIGREKPFYDVWGDTVNLASRMESSGVADHVNVSAATHALIRDHFETAHRGAIEAKNKGRVEMYFVLGPRAGATQT